MNGAEILVSCLEREGVRVVFAYPGGASMPIHQALTKSKKIRVVLAASRAGRGICRGRLRARHRESRRLHGNLGPGRDESGHGNRGRVHGLGAAWWPSPGQVQQDMIGRGAFQETDVFGMTLPMVKHSYLVWDINDIPRIVKEAFFIAQTGRPGPVLIDIPRTFRATRTQPIYPRSVKLRGYDPIRKAEDLAIHEMIGMIEHAKKPLIYCGGGVITGNASQGVG